MIIDFNYPNLGADGWRVNVVKELRDGRMWTQRMRFEDKDDAFEYYEHVKLMWRYQQERIRNGQYAKEISGRGSR